MLWIKFRVYFFFNDTATTEIYTLSLHDALPISPEHAGWMVMPSANARATAAMPGDRKSTRLNSSHVASTYAVFCLKKKIRAGVLGLYLCRVNGCRVGVCIAARG